MGLIKDIIITVATGVLAIAGVIVGAKMAGSEERKQKKRELLMESYAQFFSDFLRYVHKNDAESYRSLAVSCEKLKLICSSHSENILNCIIFELSTEDGDISVAHRMIDDLREEAKKELRK